MSEDDELIAQEATEWFVRLLEPSIPQLTRDRFSKWLLQSPQHVQAYLNVARTWAVIGEIDQETTAEELVRAARADVMPRRAAPWRVAQVSGWTQFAAAAVILIAMIGFGRLTYDRWDAADRYETAVGQQRTLELDDGSHVVLNTDTELAVKYTADQRIIELKHGEAQFTVAKDSARPFIVSTPEADVRAVGTVFNVQTLGGQTAVAVLEGRVDVFGYEQQAAVGGVSLHHGERATVSDNGAIARDAGPLFARVQAWPTQQIVFYEERLADVVAEFNRYNEQPLRIADPELAGMEISGTFAADDPESLLDFLKRYNGTQVHTAPDGSVVLSRLPRRAR